MQPREPRNGAALDPAVVGTDILRGSARSDRFELDPGGNDCDSISHYRDLSEQGLLEALWELVAP